MKTWSNIWRYGFVLIVAILVTIGVIILMYNIFNI